ncbi:unnamed protein product [Sphagnum balticum]
MLSASGFASASSYFVQDATTIGLSKDDAATATELIRAAVSENGSQVEESSSKAKFQLRPKLMKLGSAYLLKIDKLEGNKAIFSAQMKAESLEELDRVAKRVTRSVMDEVQASDTSQIEDITQEEMTKNNRRKQVLRRWSLGLGPSFVTNANNNGALFGYSIAFNWDQITSALKIYLDGASGNFIHFGIGGNYYFTKDDITPVVMAQMGYGSSYKNNDPNNPGSNSETTTGFVVGTGVGYQFFRTSSVTLELLLHGALMLNRNSLGNPAMVGFRTSLYF